MCFGVFVVFSCSSSHLVPIYEDRATLEVEATSPRTVGPKDNNNPGRRKKNRTREEQEKPNGTRVRKVGTMIKCGLCRKTGHSRTSCYRIHGIVSTSTTTPPAPTRSANPLPMVTNSAPYCHLIT